MHNCFAQQKMEQNEQNKLDVLGSMHKISQQILCTVTQTLNHKNYRKMRQTRRRGKQEEYKVNQLLKPRAKIPLSICAE